jgi:hypothetical protein
VAAVDALSLAVCGDLTLPGVVAAAPLADGGMARLHMEARGDGALSLAPWPFALPEVPVRYAARRFPEGMRWPDEAAMRAALATARWETVAARLVPG